MVLYLVDGLEHFDCRQGPDIAGQRVRQEAFGLGLLIDVMEETHDLQFGIARQFLGCQPFFVDDVAAVIDEVVVIHFDVDQGRFAEHDVAGGDDAEQFLRLPGFLQGVDSSVEFVWRNIEEDRIFIADAEMTADHGIGLAHGPAQFFPRLGLAQAAVEDVTGQDFADAEDDRPFADIGHRFIEQLDVLVEDVDGAHHLLLRFFQHSYVLTGLFTIGQGRVALLLGFVHGNLDDRQLAGLVVAGGLGLLQVQLSRPDFFILAVQLFLLFLQEFFIGGDELVLIVQFLAQVLGLLQQFIPLGFELGLLHLQLVHTEQGDADIFRQDRHDA